MKFSKFGSLSLLLVCVLLLTTAFTNAIPPLATALVNGRTYDQAHDTGYIDWTGSIQYMYVTHRDGSSLPPEEGGASCGSGCQEWVTHIGNGGSVGGSFQRDVTSFEVMVGFTHDANVGNATLRACSAVSTWTLYTGSGGGLPGFVSMPLTVPAGCRSWSLSASSGYVEFRSLDVTYVALPATPTRTITSLPSVTASPTRTRTFTPTQPPSFTPTHTTTATFTPTLTNMPTNTRTPTQTSTSTPSNTPSATVSQTSTATPTFTPTETPSPTLTTTPSPTATLLPPVIIGQVRCDLWGNAGWCRGNEMLELIASDPRGFDVTISGDLNGVPFNCGRSCSLSLREGVGTANYQVTSSSGGTARRVSTWQRDSTPPVSQITSHSNGQVVQGNVILSGKLQDEISGVASGELSLDDGTTWKAVSMDRSGTWSYTWNTNEVANGQYELQMRGMDQAGNLGHAASITLIVDNGPPHVSITDRWWIWESGKLKVSPNYFSIVSVQGTISDPQNRWPSVVLDFDPEKVPDFITWNRHFGDGALSTNTKVL